MPVDLASYMAGWAARVEAALDHYVSEEGLLGGAPPQLIEAMRYSLLTGGKRLRPILVLAAAEACGAPPERALPVACAVEMIHTYTLIHDDLPCMDNDDFRRGRPTSHRVFGEAMAVLAGDTLLTLAFEVLGREAPGAVALIARAAGGTGTAGGQVLDLHYEGREVTPEAVEAIHVRKTGALFRACLEAGAWVAGAGEAERAALREYAHHFGLAFQIVDDILDVVGDAGRLGKSVGKDQAQAKATYVRAFGLERARVLAAEAARRAEAALAPFGERGEVLRALARFAVTRDR